MQKREKITGNGRGKEFLVQARNLVWNCHKTWDERRIWALVLTKLHKLKIPKKLSTIPNYDKT